MPEQGEFLARSGIEFILIARQTPADKFRVNAVLPREQVYIAVERRRTDIAGVRNQFCLHRIAADKFAVDEKARLYAEFVQHGENSRKPFRRIDGIKDKGNPLALAGRLLGLRIKRIRERVVGQMPHKQGIGVLLVP